MKLLKSGPAEGTTFTARLKGECFAKAYISTAETPPRQDPRLSRAHEDRRRPQGAGLAPQKGPPSADARVELVSRAPAIGAKQQFLTSQASGFRNRETEILGG